MFSQNNDFYLTSLSIIITCLLDNLSLLVSLYLLDQGYVPGIFGVSRGALQFMAYEELKKGYS